MGHVIITGGSSGIGAAIARIFLDGGAHISLIARRSDLLRATAEKLGSGEADDRIRCAACDVSQRDCLSAAIGRCQDAFGPCDVLVTSAGIVEPAAFADLSSETFDRQMAVNLSGTVNAVRDVYRGMCERRSGRILMVSSGAALTGLYGYTGYCASKYAVHGFAEALRQEARPHGVGVSICFPPDTETPQLAAERLVRPAEAEAIAGMPKAWSAEAVARAAVNGMERGRFAIYPGAEMWMLAHFGPLVMPFLRMWFDRRIDAAKTRLRQGSHP